MHTPTLAITAGPISARLELLEHGVAFCAPVRYEDVVVCAEGRWAYGVDARDTSLLHAALTDCFDARVRSAGLTIEAIQRQAQGAAHAV